MLITNKQSLRYDKRKDKGLMFFSASSVGDSKAILDANIYELLVSFHYIKKAVGTYETEILPTVKEHDGLFMTDSGVFSFVNSDEEKPPEFYTENYWTNYIEEYVEFIEKHHKSMFVAANFDLDVIVGHDIVRKWNKKYFEPLEKLTQICYVAHQNRLGTDDNNGMKHFEEYCRKYKYVGVNQSNKKEAAIIYRLMKKYKVRVHGFAWTSIPLLRPYPFFSVDSTTWLGGMRYGTSYIYDGKNAKTKDHKNKYLRKADKLLCDKLGIDMDKLMNDERYEVNRFNLEGWKGFRNEYLKSANTKLDNYPAHFYNKH